MHEENCSHKPKAAMTTKEMPGVLLISCCSTPLLFCFLGSILFFSQFISFRGSCPAFNMYVLLSLLSIGLE